MIIYTGRFQPFHNGHLSLVRMLTKQYPEQTICLAIVKDVPIIHADLFDNIANKHLDSQRNPFNCITTLQTIGQVLRDEDLLNVLVTLIPRPSVETWNIIVSMFDCDRTWVFTQNRLAKDDWENRKSAFFQAQGEKIIRIPVEKKIEGTDIRKAIMQKDYSSLSSIVPDAVLRYIRQE